jgi:hypothetical protein
MYALPASYTVLAPPHSRPAVVLESQCSAVPLVASVLPKDPIADLDVQHAFSIFSSDDMLPYQNADLWWQAGDKSRL